MKNDLIDRYVYAVTKRMNRKVREDVQKELYGLIDDMLMERCGERTPTEKDIRVVLTELGSPQELYAKYTDDGEKCLIGQPYYSMYKFVLTTVLICVAAGLTIGSVVMQIMEPQTWYMAIAEYLGRIWSVGLAVFGGLTLLFAVFYRKGVKLDGVFSLDNLPSVPKKKNQISIAESIVGIVFSTIFPILFLGFPQVFCAVFKESSEIIPLFKAEALRDTWYLIVLMSVCGIVCEIVKLMERQYNRAVLVTTLVTNSISAVAAVLWLTCFSLVNPELIVKLSAAVNEADLPKVFTPDRLQNIFLVCVLIVLAIEMVETVVKTIINREK